MTKKLNVAVLGATGIVGQEFIKLLQERKFPVGELRPLASERSVGESISLNGKSWPVLAPQKGCFRGIDVAFFSAGATQSLEWGPIAVEEGAFVIDNSSAFRMQKGIALVVPEVNAHQIPSEEKPAIIANPNCSTIQLVVALKPLQKDFKLKSVVVATYQSVSGAGKAGIEELLEQSRSFLEGKKESEPKAFKHSIAFNNIPQIDIFDESGFTYEEKKIIQETQKIMELPDLDISATAVRTPTLNSHSEAVWVEFEKEVQRSDVVNSLSKAEGVVIEDSIKDFKYPLNRNASGKDAVFVGRIRRDLKNPKRWLMWVVSDNVRKGAALNGIQIAEKIYKL